MFALGIDIGTSNVCGVLLDIGTGIITLKAVVPNKSKVNIDPSLGLDPALISMQDPDELFRNVNEILASLTKGIDLNNVVSIGLTGQMHGVVCFDANLRPTMPLVTWQDLRGNLPYKSGKTYAEYVTSATGHKVSTGYGSVTYFHDLTKGVVPEKTAGIATIYDYVTMLLSGGTENIAHPSSAVSIGLFDIEKNCFDVKAIETLGLDPDKFPKIAGDYRVAGHFDNGIPVSVAIGDNQASFIGAVRDQSSSVLVNIGTGSQVSAVTDKTSFPEGIELRPFVDNKYLAVGSSLCGGRSLELLADFIKDFCENIGEKDIDPYEVIAKLTEDSTERSSLTVDTRFLGSRSDPSMRGSITNVTTGNFTPKAVACGFLDGISGELLDLYGRIASVTGKKATVVGAGGAIRKNRALTGRISRDFGGKVMLSAFDEEAAAGAALYGACSAGVFKHVEEASRLITY